MADALGLQPAWAALLDSSRSAHISSQDIIINGPD
jgi:hypothetical protein